METLLWLFNLWRKTKQKRELCVCVCVFGCIWASNSVARATRPERCANINTEKRERRRRERDWAGGKLGHSACSIKNTRHVCLGGKISERIREESRRKHKTCFMLATVKEDCRAWRGSGSEKWREAKREDKQSQWQQGCYSNRLARCPAVLVPNLKCWVLACIHSLTTKCELHWDSVVSFEQMQIML